ncbi:BTB/POZ and MATH domain-containing protein 1-like [Panicum miliaceum]|uniref:BTB/POZ and MATH domain-containing protein 1-like n=1 Tax=Panicum miliaceum TaxID=4540 RepID=A0A3L6SFT3_PANMI|nr:BTB/POZ and MATH domain-containing protein 1-like [Panicum miliaceum]
MPALDFASANVGGAVDRFELVFIIDLYWHVKQLLRNGQRIASPPFKAGGCSWSFHYYPNGISSSCKDYISFFVALDSGVSEPIKAWSRFSLLDPAGEPVPGHSVYTDVREHSEIGASHGCDLFIRKKFLEASAHLVDGCFTVGWEICVERATPPHHLLDTDVTFEVGGEAFSAHRSVLAARSPVLEAELFFSAAREGATAGDCIRIDGMLPQVFESLLHFVYTDSLPEMTDETEESMMAEHLLVAADRFDLQGLKLICEEILCRDINEDTVAKILRFAVQHQCRLLRDACIEFLEDPPVLQAVVANDDDLLELVAKTCPVLLKELWDYDEDMQDELALCF